MPRGLNSRFVPKLGNRCFCWFPSDVLVPIQVGTSMASPYKSPEIWVIHFFGYLVYGIFFWPESWRESLYIYLLSFPRFRTLSIERVWFLFWSLLNEKTSNCGRRESERCAKTWPSGQALPLLSFLLFIFVFALSQFSGPDYLGAWNRPSKARTLRPYQTKNNSKLAWCTIKALPPSFRVTKRQTSK